ncbi:hypothetical protein AB4403_04475 [Vibrio breoganii]
MNNISQDFLTNIFNQRQIKHLLIRAEVFDICVKSELISELDIENKTEKYKWLSELIERHILALSLLHKILLRSVSEAEERNIVGHEIEEVTDIVAKKIAERIIVETMPTCPVWSQ